MIAESEISRMLKPKSLNQFNPNYSPIIHFRSMNLNTVYSYPTWLYKQWYSKCHVTSNRAKSNLECAEEEFQTRGWVRGCEK
jgi:hypothetical protein